MSAFFITSSGTGVGKTLVTASLCHQLRRKGEVVEALKPVISGFDLGSDTHVLLEALGREPTPEAINQMSPWRFAAPLSPDMAAKREGREIDFSALTHFCQDKIHTSKGTVLIEGVGGVMVPLTAKETVLDWVGALNIPTLLVIGSYLGSLSHALTATHALKSAGIEIMAMIVSESIESAVPPEETAKTLSNFLADIPVILLPRLQQERKPWEGLPDLMHLLSRG